MARRLVEDRTVIEIDGAVHSGSGTIVRYAVALAALTGTSIRIKRVRYKRPKPGLRQQHLTVIRACASLSGGTFDGGHVGSTEIEFHPGKSIRPGEYHIDVGTAGSTTMLAFSLMPVALYSESTSRFRLTGGLFQDFAPTAFHMKEVLLPLLRQMGVDVELSIVRPGYVPRGEGTLELVIEPMGKALSPLRMTSRGRIERIEGIALASHLSGQRVASRMAEGFEKLLRKHRYRSCIEAMEDTSAVQKGAALAVWAVMDQGGIIGSDRAGKPGRSSEKIAAFVAHSLLEDLDSGASTDRHTADQIILFAALAEGVTEYTIPRVTDHVETNLWLVQTILGARTHLSGNCVTVEGIGYQPVNR
jgi:RNA 3'-terminal phosphate cyclase (ATP)